MQDKDRNGSISNSELETSMKELPHFKELSSADIRVLMTALDADGSGQISLDEFKGFVHGRKEFKGPVSAEEAKIMERLRQVFLGAEKKGLTIEKAFAHLVSFCIYFSSYMSSMLCKLYTHIHTDTAMYRVSVLLLCERRL